jgi:hypothetical protein
MKWIFPHLLRIRLVLIQQDIVLYYPGFKCLNRIVRLRMIGRKFELLNYCLLVSFDFNDDRLTDALARN